LKEGENINQTERIPLKLASGTTIQICDLLGIGRTTLYRYCLENNWPSQLTLVQLLLTLRTKRMA
jgi:predicted DNA-binding transcriptional regulator AlpA